MLGTFFGLVLVLFIITAAAAITGFVLGGDVITENLEDALNDSLKNYYTDSTTKDLWDTVQEDVSCLLASVDTSNGGTEDDSHKG